MSRNLNDGGIRTDGDGDAELMIDLRAQRGEALATLLRRYARLVHRVASGILRDPGEAEDVTQEVFLEVYCKAHLYDPARGSVRVWLLQYAYHRSLRRKDALRRRAAYRGEPIDAGEARSSGSRRELTREECRWVIRAGFEHLPPRQRLALELTCLEGFSLSDVAARLGVSLGCARHYYYRGLARLRVWAARVQANTCPAVGGAAGRGATASEPVRLEPSARQPARRRDGAVKALRSDHARRPDQPASSRSAQTKTKPNDSPA